MSKILTTHKERLIAYRNSMMAEATTDEERAANHKTALFDYRHGLAEDIDRILNNSGLLKTATDPHGSLRRDLAEDLAKYVTGEH